MADTIVDVVSKADFAAAQKEIAELRQRLEAAKEDKVKEQVTALEKTLSSRDDEIKNLKTELDNAKASKKDIEKSLETVKADVEGFKTKLTEAETKLAENAKSVVKANRISALVDKGVEKAEAEKIVETSAAASDELFAVILDTQAKLVDATKKAAEAAAMLPADEKAKKDKQKKDEKQAAKADEQKLDEAKPDQEAALATETVDTETDTVVAGLAEFLAQERKNNK